MQKTVKATSARAVIVKADSLHSESKIPPEAILRFLPKRLRIFSPDFTLLLKVPIYARLQIFIQLPATLTKLCHIKRDHPVHIMLHENVHHRPKRTLGART